MKIKPSKHNVLAVDAINIDTDIPLAYIGYDNNDYDVSLSDFQIPQKDIVMPYDTFDSGDIILFDELLNVVDNTKVIKRNGTQFYFMPENYRTFSPQRFTYNVVGKKNMTYKSDRIYNITLGCSSSDIAQNIMKICGDAPDKGICPNNIYINSKELLQVNFLDEIDNKDITIIESSDGKHYKGGDGSAVIDYNSFLDNYTNLWISCDTYGSNIIDSIQNSTVDFSIPVIKNQTVNYTSSVFSSNILQYGPLSSLDYNLISVSSGDAPFSIIEISGKGHIIISHSSFFDYILNNAECFYDALMYVYCNGYIKSSDMNAWVTDVVPDYVTEGNNIVHYDKIYYDINTTKLFGISSDDIIISSINISADNVYISDLNNNRAVFSKSTDSKYASLKDPVILDTEKTLLSSSGEIICYSDFVYKIRDDLTNKVGYVKDTNKIYIKIQPFIDSLNGINIKEQTTLTLDFSDTLDSIEYIIYCKNNIVHFIEKSNYTADDGCCLFQTSITRTSTENTIYDMRVRGGGSITDNDDLLDVGHAKGKPYRRGSSLIIRLPIKYQQYEDYIKETVSKHCSGSKLPIILFEEA